MATGLVDIANNAAGKIGGFGDEVSGSGLVTAAQLSADTIRSCQWINDKYGPVRQKVIKDFAAMGCPFIETRKFADLGADLKQYDVAISSIAVGADPFLVTITTDEAHGRATGDNSDTVYLTGIEQDEDEDVDDIEQTRITSLNGTTETIIVTTTTAFTIATAGAANWVHKADSGIVSYCPEMGPWSYAFILPSDFFTIVRQCDELYTSDADYTVRQGVRKKYQCQPILNRDGDGHLLLSNDLSNANADGAYIEYCIDQTTFALFSDAFEECIATLLAAEMCPILGKNMKVRQDLLLEYDQYTVPAAKRAIQSQIDNSSKSVLPDYSGGRSAVLRGTSRSETVNYGYTAI
jgi:hypothetical protein